MSFITKICQVCAKEFQAKLSEHKRGNSKTCSKKCGAVLSSRVRTKIKIPNATCAFCKIEFYMRPSSKKNSKSGIFFCCRTHKDMAQRLGGIPEIQPAHYGTGNGISTYRDLAFSHYDARCNQCGYQKFKEVLDVHHIDNDRSNNNIENLEILCPTCHRERHYILKTGWYARSKK
jgi:hypothetical protein